MSNKGEMRKEVKRRLAALTASEKDLLDEAIAETVLSSREYREAKSLFIYYSMAEEAGTHRIVASALAEGKEVFLPRMEGEWMSVIPYHGESLLPNAYGILEPTGEGTNRMPDLVILPLLAFDKDKHRLGRGKGYYDRYLSEYRGTSIAIAYSVQEEREVPTEAGDVPPTIIITDKERIE